MEMNNQTLSLTTTWIHQEPCSLHPSPGPFQLLFQISLSFALRSCGRMSGHISHSHRRGELDRIW